MSIDGEMNKHLEYNLIEIGGKTTFTQKAILRGARELHKSRGFFHQVFWIGEEECSECVTAMMRAADVLLEGP